MEGISQTWFLALQTQRECEACCGEEPGWGRGVWGQKYAHRAIKHLLIEELVTECHNMASSSWRVTEAHQHTTAVFTRACNCELAVLADVMVGLRF